VLSLQLALQKHQKMTNHEEVEHAIATTILAQVHADVSNAQINGGRESTPLDPTIKLTHEQLFALPEELQMQYFKSHGSGVLAVMGKMIMR
jgi:hypothetical protein